jgi:hypothetical protein
MIVNAQALNRFDAAKAIESALQNDYSYSLQMKAGGVDPLADFLFNVKAGHCEYFSTAMAILLRTHGIATRVVNGFLPGEYNDAANAFRVRQSDAHSWVEVYFPESRAWVTFDPTPPAGKTEPVRTGFAAQLKKYAEAMELVWYQYVVGYDKQEQQTLATSLHTRVFEYSRLLTNLLGVMRRMLPTNVFSIFVSALALILLVLTIVILRRVRMFGWRRGLSFSQSEEQSRSSVVFYERLLSLMAERGFQRDSDQTPLEFARKLGSRDAALITRAYNRVRFGNEHLSTIELNEINRILSNLESVQG